MKSTREELQFDEQEIQLLFGCEAAEDESRDRLRKYYYKTHVYNQVITDLPLRVLVGHKGIGKSALFQVAMSEEEEQNKLVVLIKPDDVIDIGKKSTSFMEMIREWKTGIIEIVARKVLTNLDIPEKSWSKNIKNLGGKLTDYLLQILGSMSEINIQFAKKEIIHQYQKSKSIYIYIDDLDRGWEGKKEDINRLSALLNAVRDLSTERNRLFFRIALRSDVYFLVRTSDESTDKIEGSVIWHTWSNNDIFLLWIKRVESFFGNEIDEHTLRYKKQKELAYLLNRIMENRFLGVGHWRNAPMYRVFMSLIRQRPRDLVKLCTLAARNTYERRGNLISTLDVKRSFEEYSQGRMQDTINEFRSELPAIEKLLLGMKPNRKERTTRQGYVYTTGDLIQKIRNIQELGEFKFSTKQRATERELAAFMYKINFLTGRKGTSEDGGIIRTYFEQNRYLASTSVEFGFDWEIHPAYRWALQPDDIGSILESLEPSSDD